MYHGGNSTLLGDKDEPTPVCDSSHPNFCYLGMFFFWCKTYRVWGGWLSEPLLTSEQLEDPNVQMWLEQRHALACHLKAAQSFEEPSQPSSPPIKLLLSDRPLSHKKGVKRASAFDVKSEITSSTNYDQGDLVKDPVTILFWQKSQKYAMGKRKAGKAAEETTYGDTVDSIESTHEEVSRTMLQVPFVSNPAGVKDYNQDGETSKREHLDTEVPEKDQKDKKLTQNRQFLDEYKTDADLLSVCDMALNTDVTLGKICGCRKGIIEVQCEDCLEYRATCRQCWIQEHSRYMWWHWALVWNRDGDFFQHYNFSCMLDPTPAIQLGHMCHFQFCHCQAIPEGLPYKEEHLEGKVSVYDFVGALRRYTDNVFPYDVPDVGKQLRQAFCVWNLIKTNSRLGQNHGIDNVLTRRLPGNLVVWHLNQLNLLLNGNFHVNKLKKKLELDDISLFEGRKFKTMEVTGMVNCTCNHVCVFGTVDLHLGEQFCNTDAALLQALKLHMPSQEKNDLVIMLSYDCNCSYHRNINVRFQGVAFDGVCYFQCNGHNHREGIEQYWAVINALGPQIRQMNNGYWQDTLIIHHSDHNWKKTYTQAYHLVIELEDGKYLYRKKRDFYKAHSAYCQEQYPEAFEEWQKVVRYETYKDGKDIVSPFCFHSKQFPSLKSVITRLATIATTTEELFKKKEELALRKDDKSSAEEVTQEETPSIPSARATTFLYEGILLEIDQYIHLHCACI
ncbi:hypothetical protein IW261DRAFT_1425340 [Armillaria novae-zelandiae]|uniref:CxC2-like cysteine cluster KDZ transposase-associated domain-containing protein n=1 Tax=Armillaria novae-zelandiae TaxID=153914 RepID=A0AA39NSV3_9AGAR|nr:hypothetical protein IW261DRAFT_1425340 [Armillaria novae-zelandiae]